MPVLARGAQDRERVGVADVIPERDHHGLVGAASISRAIASRLATGVGRPQVHDQPTAVVGEAVRRRPRSSVSRNACWTASRAASRSAAPTEVERHGRTLRLDVQPLGWSSRSTDPDRECPGDRRCASKPGWTWSRAESGRAPRGQPAGLEAVVAEVLDAADPDAGRRRRPRCVRSGRRPATGSGRAAPTRARRRSARRASGSIAAASGSPEPRPASHRSRDTIRIGPAGARRVRQPELDSTRAHRSVMRPPSRRDVDPRQDRLAARAAMTSGPIPPSAPSRTIPSRSIQKWTGRTIASHVRRAVPSVSSPIGNVALSDWAKAATVPSSSLTSIASDDEAVVRVAGGEAVHQRELVLAGRARRSP